MMGAHHAATGAAAWVALTSTLNAFPAFGIVPMTPAEVGIGAVVCAGAALLPDADHPSATIARSAGFLSKAASSAVSAGSGGHRNGTHSGMSAIVVLVLAWLFTRQGWINDTPGSPFVIGAGVVAAVMFAFAVKVLKIAPNWPRSWAVGIVVSAVITIYFPALWAWLPLSIAVGWVVHMAGDFLTTGGLPIFWPFAPKPPKWLGSTPVWSRGGYFALPILGRAGSKREWALCIPVSLYALVGAGLNLLAALLREEQLVLWATSG